MADGIDVFADRMGITRGRAQQILRQHPDTAARVAELSAHMDAAGAVAEVDVLRSLGDDDLAACADQPDPEAALRDLVADRSFRKMRAELAAHVSWANTEDPEARTRPARDAFRAKFEAEVDPDGILEPAERARRAEHARQAHYKRMALKSAKARRERKAAAGD